MAPNFEAGEVAVPVWLDCDPGHDDAIAIILAGHNPSTHLLGISTVAGNQTLTRVTENARRVVHAAGLVGVEVIPCQAQPLMRPAMACAEIHGETGLDGPGGGPLFPPLPLPARTNSSHSTEEEEVPGIVRVAQRIAAAAATQPSRRVRLVATGALTNVALLLTLYPGLKDRLDVVFMGGALGSGNTAPVAEFNIEVDPEAAHIVLSSGVPTTMVPLEVTHTALVTREVAAAVAGGSAEQPSSPFRQKIYDLLHFFADTYKEVFDFDSPPLHDPCAVAFVIDSSLFQTRFWRVDVETHSLLSAGQTVTDVRRTTGRPPNVHVCVKMDVPSFWRLVLDALEAADAASPLNAACTPVPMPAS